MTVTLLSLPLMCLVASVCRFFQCVVTAGGLKPQPYSGLNSIPFPPMQLLETYAAEVAGLPPAHFDTLMQSLEFGLQHSDPISCTKCGGWPAAEGRGDPGAAVAAANRHDG